MIRKSIFFLTVLILGLFIVAGVNVAVRAYNDMCGGEPLPLLLQVTNKTDGIEILLAGHRVQLNRKFVRPLLKTLSPYREAGFRLARLYWSELGQTLQTWKQRLWQYTEKTTL